jgi:cellulose biosynthesis protein BcsQ
VDNALVIANGKGGCGKTTVAANLAVLAARSGHRVLAIDLDKQGNLTDDLGVVDHDEGGSLVSALVAGTAPVPVRDVRPGLDVIAGGERTEHLQPALMTLRARNKDALSQLDRVLAPLGATYDLVVLDSPPTDAVIGEAALIAARWLLIPTKADSGSLKGLIAVATAFAQVRSAGLSVVELAGVVLFGVGTQSQRIRSDTRTALEKALGHAAPVLQTVIRTSERSAVDQRSLGITAVEYAEHVRAARPWYNPGGEREHLAKPAVADGLAHDYEALAEEVFAAIGLAPPAAA